MPLTLRILYHGLRGAWSGFLIASAGWITLVGVTPAERAALGSPGHIDRPQGLLEMRMARMMVHVAPERAAAMLSDASNGEISPELAGMMLREIANGPVASRAAFDEMTRPAPQDNSVADGAKRVQVGGS